MRERTYWFILALIVVIASFWGNTTYYSMEDRIHVFDISPIRIVVSIPKYITPEEEAKFRFAVENTGSDDMTVLFRLTDDKKFYSFLSSQGTSTFYTGTVASEEQVSGKLDLLIPWRSNQTANILGQNMNLSLWGNIDNGGFAKIGDFTVKVAPIPWSRTLSALSGAVLGSLILWLIKELLEQEKEYMKQSQNSNS